MASTDTALTAQHYDINANDEHSRLMTFSLEYQISLRVILDCIGKLQVDRTETEEEGGKEEHEIDKTLKILDLGGGTGRYGKASVSFFLSLRLHSFIESFESSSCSAPFPSWGPSSILALLGHQVLLPALLKQLPFPRFLPVLCPPMPLDSAASIAA